MLLNKQINNIVNENNIHYRGLRKNNNIRLTIFILF